MATNTFNGNYKIYCNTDFDAVVLDLEHGVFNNETLFSLIQLINVVNSFLC